jgi:hypothetical protein
MSLDRLKEFEADRDFNALMMRQAEEVRAKRAVMWARGPKGSREKFRLKNRVNAEIHQVPKGI